MRGWRSAGTPVQLPTEHTQAVWRFPTLQTKPAFNTPLAKTHLAGSFTTKVVRSLSPSPFLYPFRQAPNRE